MRYHNLIVLKTALLLGAFALVSCGENENRVSKSTIKTLVEDGLNVNGETYLLTGYFGRNDKDDLDTDFTKSGVITNQIDTIRYRRLGFFSYYMDDKYYVNRQVLPEYEKYVTKRDTVVRLEPKEITVQETDPNYALQVASSKEYAVRTYVKLLDFVVTDVTGLSVKDGVASVSVQYKTRNVTPFGISIGIKDNLTKQVSNVLLKYVDGEWTRASEVDIKLYDLI